MPERRRLPLATRTLAEALRLFAPAATRARVVAADSEIVAMVDHQTLTGEPRANAVLVYSPSRMLLDTLRFDVSTDDWDRFVGHTADPGQAQVRVGALRGGVLVALAAAGRPEGRLARLRVLVSPAFRQLGLGHLVLHRAVQHVLREGLLPYATLRSTDLGARALARAVGFVNVSRFFDQLAPAY